MILFHLLVELSNTDILYDFIDDIVGYFMNPDSPPNSLLLLTKNPTFKIIKRSGYNN